MSKATGKLFTSFNSLFVRLLWLKSFIPFYYPDWSGKSHDAHECLKRKMSLGLAAFDLLTSIKLPHIQCGDPLV